MRGEKPKLTEVEEIKDTSDFLRGTIKEGLEDRLTGAIAASDTQLTKFHGVYQQDDRDLRNERRKQKLEPLYSFMVRVRVPGGVCTPEQWLVMDDIADTHANGTMKLTTRQAFQFHGVFKRNLKATIQEINAALLDTIAACGDVNRNVMCNPNPYQSELHAAVYECSKKVSAHLTPGTTAYHEIWLNGEKVVGRRDEEPIYGKTYLPRKFKMAFAVPPSNDIDIFSQDLGFTAIVEEGRLTGFNVSAGGGMGVTHSEPETYPRVADVIGFCLPEQVVDVAEKVVTVQRDFGDRTNRKHARLKYTIEDRGVEWFKGEVEDRLGFKLEEARPYRFDHNGDRYGWVQGHDGRWHLTLFIQNGRVKDAGAYSLKTGLREVAKIHDGDFRLTGNQNVIIAGISEENRSKVEACLKEYGMRDSCHQSGLRLNSMACVAFPTCGLAMAESERYLPGLLDKLDAVLAEVGLKDEPITIRMTGCPNGCARPYIAEIAFVGKAPGKYNLYLGGGFAGDRLNKLYRESLSEEETLRMLTPMFSEYAKERREGEHFGDFVIRKGHIAEVKSCRDFHV
ncbi:MAG: assimilatory sulfite reductase (NADPH) hemoprotein subunit [Verrucomicrobia bacterium]|nr:assimilatory sulfite reductase (NADPH) hemoprotein subunit [Verrucomicrobiota bacterium]